MDVTRYLYILRIPHRIYLGIDAVREVIRAFDLEMCLRLLSD